MDKLLGDDRRIESGWRLVHIVAVGGTAKQAWPEAEAKSYEKVRAKIYGAAKLST